MPKLIYSKPDYFFLCSEESTRKKYTKAAKFKLDRNKKVWYTADEYKALQLIYLMHQDNVQIELDTSLPNSFYLKFEVLTESQTESAPIYFAPLGKKYLPYQNFAIDYMFKNKKVLLADEQGLGKTIEVAGLINQVTTNRNIRSITGPVRVLLICPAVVKLNWKKELENWLYFPADIRVFNGRNGSFDVYRTQKRCPDAPIRVDVLNYDIVTFEKVQMVLSTNYDIAVCDEAHYLKNRDTVRTQTLIGSVSRVRELQQTGKLKNIKEVGLLHDMEYLILATGTPMTNQPIDLWPLLDALDSECIRPYQSYWNFAKYFCEAKKSAFGWKADGAKNVGELHVRMRTGVMLRRTKEQVLPQLPDKQYQIITFQADKKLKKIIDQREQGLPNDVLERVAGGYKTGLDGGELATVRREMAEAKLLLCVEYIKEMMETTEKVVVFAWHKEIVACLAHHLVDFKPVTITGATKQDAREEAVESFQTNPQHRIFIGNIKAAGVGITLTAASNMVFVESSWSPADISQAVDRCHRKGQKDSVLAKFLVVEGSVESAIYNTVVKKLKTMKKVVDNA